MKNIIISSMIFIFSFCANIFADSTTSGVGLIKPTTGAIDTKRSWADKINSNFDVIGSTLNTLNTRANQLSNKIIVSSNVENVTIESFKITLSTHIPDGEIVGSDIANNTITGNKIAASGGITITSFTALSGSNRIVYDAAGIYFSSDGSTQTKASSGGSSSASTYTAILTAGNVDAYLASAPSVTQDFFVADIDTLTIISVTPFCIFTSTVADTQFALVKTTETGNTNIKWLAVDTSSFTVPVNLKYGNIDTSMSDISNVFPRETLGFWTTLIPSSGTLPADCGLTINYFKRPRP